MTAESSPSGTLILFAREPVAGQVKTRLIPALGAEGAARLYRRLLGIALRAGAATHGARRQLWCAGAPAEGGECARLADAHGFTWHRQSEGAETRATLRRIGLTWTELPTLRDLDRPEDLADVAHLLDTNSHPD